MSNQTNSQIIKKCGCGRVYSRDIFLALPIASSECCPSGTQEDVDDNGKPVLLVFRNCWCGSTIAIETVKGKDVNSR